jgi:hypothetical protein
MNPFDFASAVTRFVAETPDTSEREAAWTLVPRREFSAAIAQAGWRQLSGGETYTPDRDSHVIVVGAAPWSRKDMDALGGLLRRVAKGPYQILIFDIDSCRSADDVVSLMPGAPPPMQTPAVSEYVNGDLVRHLTGGDAIEWLVNR